MRVRQAAVAAAGWVQACAGQQQAGDRAEQTRQAGTVARELLMAGIFTGAGCRDAVRRLATAGDINYLSGIGQAVPCCWQVLAVGWETEDFIRAAVTGELRKLLRGKHVRADCTFGRAGLHRGRTAGLWREPASRPAATPPPAWGCR